MKDKIIALLKQAEDAYNASEGLRKKVEAEDRDFTETELKEYEAFLVKSNDLKGQSDRLHDQDEKRSELDKYFNDPEYKRSMNPTTPRSAVEPEVDDKKALNDIIRFKMGRGKLTPELQKALTRYEDLEGGFWVGEEFSTELISGLKSRIQVRQAATVIQTNAAKITFPASSVTITYTERKDNATVADGTPSSPAGKLSFTPHSVSAIVKLPNELIEDATFDIMSYFKMELLEGLARHEEPLFINGNGVDQPLGILKAGGIAAVDVETTTSAEIVANDIQGLPYSLEEQYQENGRWLMSRAYVKKAMLLKDLSNGADTGRYLWQPSFQAGQPALLAGFPVMQSEYMPAVSSDGDAVAIFGDFSQYLIVERMMPSIKVLDQLYAATINTGLQIIHRYDGGVRDVNAFVRLNRT